jgi:hypothetical protein
MDDNRREVDDMNSLAQRRCLVQREKVQNALLPDLRCREISQADAMALIALSTQEYDEMMRLSDAAGDWMSEQIKQKRAGSP